MTETCRWLHEQLEALPLLVFPFDPRALPKNGIYFFYENGEAWGHGGDKPRIVRVGTHKDGNFRTRISEHFLLNESKMAFDANKPAPKDRSIFRKNIGRALLNRDGDPYLGTWDLDFTAKETRERHGHERDTKKEKIVEAEVTRILRERFSFRFVVVDAQAQRLGRGGLESVLIGTAARCEQCSPSLSWLGRSSPIGKIRDSGLWQVQHLDSPGLHDESMAAFSGAIELTRHANR